MHKLLSAVVAVLFALGLSTAFAGESEEEMKAKCEEKAKEEGVAEADMEDYVQKCMEEMKAEKAG